MDSRKAWQTPEISVVVPLCNEEENLPELYRRLVQTLEDATSDFELVFVDDGSRDRTPDLLNELHDNDARVVVVSLSRNFGHQPALSAGIDHAQGQAVILMDGDLQDPPEVLPRLIAAWEAGSDVVYAVRTKRKESGLKRLAYAAFYRLWNALSNIEVPLDAGDFGLMDRRVVDALRALPERNRLLRGLRAFVGFKQVGVAYERDARRAGQTKYTLAALGRLACNAFTGFSDAPLRLVSSLGGLLLTFAILGAAFTPLSMTALLVIACTGLQLLGLGIVGAYVHRILVEVQGRPTYVVAQLKQAPQRHWQEAPVS